MDPSKPRFLGQWSSRGPVPPTAECWPEVWATPSPRPGTGQARCPQWPGSTFPCTASAEQLLTQQLESWVGQYCQWGVGGRYQNLAAMPETKTRPRCRGRAQESQAGCLKGNLIPISSSLPGEPVPSPQASSVALGLWGQTITGATVVTSASGQLLPLAPDRPVRPPSTSRLGPGSQFLRTGESTTLGSLPLVSFSQLR